MKDNVVYRFNIIAIFLKKALIFFVRVENFNPIIYMEFQ